MSDPFTTPAVLDQMARELPDGPALVSDTRSFTFAGLRETVRTAAAAMIARGVEAGDRVAIWSPNSWHWVVAALGAHHAGAVVVPVNPAFTPSEAADVLSRTRTRLLIAGQSQLGDPRDLPTSADIVPIARGEGADWDFLAGSRAPASDVDVRAAAVAPDTVSEILFTSGTTGRSKGVVASHRQSMRLAVDWAACAGMSNEDRYLCINPLAFNFGYRGGMIVCLARGAALLPSRSFDPVDAMRVIAEQRITVVPGPPTLFQALLDHPARGDYDLSSLRVAVIGAAAVPRTLIERARAELGFRDVLNAYGLTESTAAATMCRCGDDTETAAMTSGRPIAGFTVRIETADDDGIGEVLLRGPNVMLGYLDDPDATAEAIDSEGWLHTGDLGTLDPQGNLRITGRLKDMYICGGANVYPAEVEQALARCDGVAAAAVIGVPDERLGEAGRAFVVPAPDADLDPQQIIAGLRSELAAFKIPTLVVVVDDLPRNSSGKILKTALREIADTAPTFIPPRLGGPPVGTAENWIADAWQLLLSIARPGRRDRFIDLGGDSLAAMEFSRMLRTRFGIDMSVDTLAELPTIADIVAALTTPSHPRRQPAVRLRADDDGPVCLLVPGIGGHAWTFAAAAAKVTAPCELWALSLMDVREGPPEQIRDRIHAAALQTLQSAATQRRPIVIAGYSFGALIAAELAGWLTRNHIPVTRFLLIDPDPLDSEPLQWNPRTLHRRPGMFTIEPGSPAARQLAKDVDEVADLLQRAYVGGGASLPDAPVFWLRTSMMAEEHSSATTVFGRAIGSIEQTVVDMTHLDLIRIPHVTQLSAWLDGQLVGVQAAAADR